MPRLNFGAFLAPHHPIGEHPMLQFRRDLDLVEHLDKLGYDEFWCGEHHSSGWEMIGSPEMFLAAAGERSKRIKLATGVVSLPYHHPFNVAQRMVQLDHMTGGRAITQANTTLVYEALKRLDLYIVHDFFMTPSGQLADYVLPAASWLERPYLYNGFGFGKFLVAGEEALPPVSKGEYDRKTDYDLWRTLGVSLGQEKYWPAKTLEEAYDYRLKPLGMSFKQFVKEKKGFDFPKAQYKKYEEHGFGTPTGKVELYSTIFEKLGYSPLPVYQEPPESPFSQPTLTETYPLILITGGRFDPYYASEHRQISTFRKRRPEPSGTGQSGNRTKLGNKGWRLGLG